jgi:hypothetical protein
MIGISKLVGIDKIFYSQYNKLSTLDKLRFELYLAKHSGISGYDNSNHLKRIKDIELIIQKEERKQKIQKLNDNK